LCAALTFFYLTFIPLIAPNPGDATDYKSYKEFVSEFSRRLDSEIISKKPNKTCQEKAFRWSSSWTATNNPEGCDVQHIDNRWEDMLDTVIDRKAH